jgi:FkbM family methyltransferase
MCCFFSVSKKVCLLTFENVEIVGVRKVAPDRILNFGGHSLLDRKMIVSDLKSIRDDTRDIVKVELIAIDDLKLVACDFIKIDVQGMELEVLLGAEKTIRKFGPTIYTENETRDGHADKLREFLFKLGYTCLQNHMVNLFNPNNFKKQSKVIFDSETHSVNMLCKPEKLKAE